MLLTELLGGLSYTCAVPLDGVEISDIVYDSRKAEPGCVFFCLRGADTDGHRYAGSAVQKGAAAIVAEDPLEGFDVPVILVEDTRRAMACASAAYFGHPARSLRTIGVTGTKGKTTTACMIRSVLERAGHKTGMIGTLGIVIGSSTVPTNNTTPESYEIQRALRRMVEAGCSCAVLEASSLGLKWHRTGGFQFDYGVFTNFSPDHIGSNEHASLEEYLACKSLLFRNCRKGLLNRDDPRWQEVLGAHTCEVSTFGFSPGADLVAVNDRLVTRPGFLGAAFELHGALECSVEVGIPGKFSVYNALAAAAVCREFGVSVQALQAGLQEVKVKGRVEPVPVPGNYTLLIDYAHNAVSMENILTTLREYNPHRLVCLFGAGGNRARARRFEMGEISGKLADLSVITADNSRDEDVMDILADIKTGLAKTNGKFVEIPDRREAIRYCIEHAEEGDIIVLAGKGHEDYQEIHGVKRHFDEREIVRDILEDLKKD